MPWPHTYRDVGWKDDQHYHYHLNREYPYSVGCFRGIVDYVKALPNSDMTEGLDYGRVIALVPRLTTSNPTTTLTQSIQALSINDQNTFFQVLSKIINNILR